MEEQILRIFDHREQLRIVCDPDDGYIVIDAFNGNPDGSYIYNESVVVGFGFTLSSALSDLEGNIMEFDQKV